MNSNAIYQIVTEQIIKQLEKGIVPWKKSWTTPEGAPSNLITGYTYKGINRVLLASFTNPYFLTFNQLRKAGGKVRKGEKATSVVFWKVNKFELLDPETKEITEKKTFLLRYYNVFNVSQCENLKHKRLKELKKLEENKREIIPIDAAEAIVKGFHAMPEIRFGEHFAYYSPKDDYIGMLDRHIFIDDPSYYAVLFHEMIHATGHKTRLNRFKTDRQDVAHQDSYGKEELVAEMGAGFLCGVAGIEHIESCASYLQNWIDTLKGDVSLLVKAGSMAQKATDYVLGK
jgi:antirestriction protein ArdC